MAVAGKDANVRRLAAEYLTDQKTLSNVAVDDVAPEVRLAAVKNLTVQSVLAAIALRLDDQVSLEAALRLTDQALVVMVFVETGGQVVAPAKSGQRSVTRSAVHAAALARLNTPALLIKTIFGAGEMPADEVLAKFAVDTKDEGLRYAAAGGIQNIDVLEKIPSTDVKDRIKTIVALRHILVEIGILQEPVWILVRRTGAGAQAYDFGSVHVNGEIVQISIMTGEGTVLAYKSWMTEFPSSVRFGTTFISANADLTDLIADLTRTGRSTPAQIQSAMARIIAEDKDPQIRRAAVKKLTDESVLARAAMKDNDVSVRLAAVARLTDQALLATLATTAADGWNTDVRVKATEKIKDQIVLAKLALEDKDATIRNAAVLHLTDQAALAHVVMGDKNSFVKRAAVARLTDQALLTGIAMKSADAGSQGSRLDAIKKLTDQALLTKLASDDPDSQVRRTAVQKLTDQSLLAKLAAADKDEYVRTAAVHILTDQTALTKLAEEDTTSAVRTAAVERLSDQAALSRIAVADKDQYVRWTAVERLTGQTLLAKLATDDTNDRVRQAARKRLDTLKNGGR